jgi:hypothetical protein
MSSTTPSVQNLTAKEVKIMNGVNISLNPFVLRRWIYGLPAPVWLRNIEMIGKVIQENKLQPVDRATLFPLTVSEGAVSEKEKAALVLDRRPYPGGIRISHLHFMGEVYLVKEDLWRDLSGKIVKDFQAKLANVRNVSFEQTMELSEAVESLG